MTAGLEVRGFEVAGFESSRFEVAVEQTRLDNGLTVAVSVDPGLGFVVVDSWHATGSMDDGPGRSGLAHLAEHVCFGASGADGAAPGLRGRGANATTSFERTNFIDAGPADTFAVMVARIGDRLQHDPSPDELQRHRDVVLQEIAQREDRARFGSGLRRSLRLLFGAGHRFGQPALGCPAELADLDRLDVARFVADGYGAATTVVSVVGPIEANQVFEQVADACSSMPLGPSRAVSLAPPRAMPLGPPRAAMPASSRASGPTAARREEVDEGQAAGLLRFAFALPSDGAALGAAGEVLMAALTGAPWTVFGTRFAAERGLLAATGEHVRSHDGPSVGMLRLAVPPSDDLAGTEAAVRARLASVAAGDLADGVLRAAIARCRKQRLALLSSARSRAEELCCQRSWFGDAAHVNTKSYDHVSAADLALVARDAFADPAVVVFHPAGVEEPTWIP